jgi:hypothetical protein
MTLMSRLRQISFLMIIAVTLAPSPVVTGFDSPICPSQQCDYCPADWMGSCWIEPWDTCEEYLCNGPYGPCVIEGTQDPKQVCVCPRCNT